VHQDIAKILLTEEMIQAKVKELAAQISDKYRGTGRPLHAIVILKGATFFAADLLRRLDIPARVDFMAISSYGTRSSSSGVVRILKDLDHPIEGQDVLVIEDIVDSGRTLNYLLQGLKQRNPASLSLCVLLDKPDRRVVDVHPEFVGFEIPDEFVVGYGLDYAELYRNLPYIGVLKPELYKD
jgi:hypoxanthine phosphoribosyltransferase